MVAKLISGIFHRVRNCWIHERNVRIQKSMKRCDSRLYGEGIHINRPENVEIEDSVFVGDNVTIDAYSKVKICRNTQIASGVKIISGNHGISKNELIKDQSYTLKPVTIEEDVWIGFNAIILPGTILRKGTVVGAGAVISGETVSYGVYGGVPAKLIKLRS